MQVGDLVQWTNDMLVPPVRQVGVIIDMLELLWGEEFKRARDPKGRFVGDDKSTPNYNEAWEGGKSPKKKIFDK